jgi:hypothetical protein
MADKYIIGYTGVEYFIGDVLIPKRSYTEFERQHGKKPYAEVSEEQLETLKKNKVFNTLLQNKMIRVLDHIPNFALSGEDRANRRLAEAEKRYTDEVEKLKAELAEAKAKLAELL